MHLRLADAFLCGAVGESDDEDSRRRGIQGVQGVQGVRGGQDIALEVVDGNGDGIGRKGGDGIGPVGELETDETVVLLNLCDGLSHQFAAITGIE